MEYAIAFGILIVIVAVIEYAVTLSERLEARGHETGAFLVILGSMLIGGSGVAAMLSLGGI